MASARIWIIQTETLRSFHSASWFGDLTVKVKVTLTISDESTGELEESYVDVCKYKRLFLEAVGLLMVHDGALLGRKRAGSGSSTPRLAKACVGVCLETK